MVIGINLKVQILANTMEWQLAWVDAGTKGDGISAAVAKIVDNVLAITNLE